jgi:hypothetical protein
MLVGIALAEDLPHLSVSQCRPMQPIGKNRKTALANDSLRISQLRTSDPERNHRLLSGVWGRIEIKFFDWPAQIDVEFNPVEFNPCQSTIGCLPSLDANLKETL